MIDGKATVIPGDDAFIIPAGARLIVIKPITAEAEPSTAHLSTARLFAATKATLKRRRARRRQDYE